ncbi:MAG: CoA transferase, partial [Dehalococcoidia bacterium]|nr:CoA transferase [Dehalococcoidia bacterium]
MPDRALSGTRVLEYGHHVSAPYCAKLLAELGAEVVKIEPPPGEEGRRIGPFAADRPHPERSLLFLYFNTGKKGITLNPADRCGKGIFLDLV